MAKVIGLQPMSCRPIIIYNCPYLCLTCGDYTEQCELPNNPLPIILGYSVLSPHPMPPETGYGQNTFLYIDNQFIIHISFLRENCKI